MDWTDRIGRRIKLRDLHVLLAVVECGSMAKAAESLAITHPVVSKTISDLERTLGVQLFDRSAKGVELTAYGQILLDSGAMVFDELRQGLRRIEHLADPGEGELRIGCPDIMNAGVIPPLVDEFLRRWPKVRLHVLYAETGAGQFQLLRERRVDLLVGRLPMSSTEEDLAVECLFDEPFLAFAAMGSSWARRRRIALAELMGEAWTLPPYDSVPGVLIAGIFRASGLEPPRTSVVTQSANLSAALVGTGNFVGLLPSSVLHFSAKRLSLKGLPVQLPDTRISVSVITLKRRTLSPLAELFVQCAREVTKPLS
ncbi:LysR family transcriptional regulator [Belnapia sp. T6]|uniref:LysR family transcriptional regulator n=1 Tax=Belnapia mucosa TaxID=2804532 RepID=A0ABS1VCK1_9PROT|nr:LysR family transcriptional regulator [Belnapia mucosa]MBL6458871.1 LysR family transcriptional regulator [Belnapia mucosa]